MRRKEKRERGKKEKRKKQEKKNRWDGWEVENSYEKITSLHCMYFYVCFVNSDFSIYYFKIELYTSTN